MPNLEASELEACVPWPGGEMKRIALAVMTVCLFCVVSTAADLDQRVKHEYADSGGVKIHYATLGPKKMPATGVAPLIVMIHGFPDFWYTWRDQMEALSETCQVAALDQRGYNLSDKPAGVENYDVRLLVGDVAAVLKHLKREKAIIVGHDWGGLVAWSFATAMPEKTEKLIISR